ncbi:MAG: hypothetical protein JWQ12_1088 [Glaciihabitans sp.]|nr:hypothetical protein [Glaciihabitans sp.]
MSAARLRLLSILAIAVVAALTLLSATQLWWTIRIPGRSLDVAGTVASSGLSALALTGLALAAALAIAGPVFRVVLGVLQLLIGGTVVLAAATSIASPSTAAASVITKATGVAGTASVDGLVDSISSTAWPAVAVIAGILSFLLGVFVLATFRRWPGPSRKYSAVRMASADATGDPVVSWDALSEGDDPTSRD